MSIRDRINRYRGKKEDSEQMSAPGPISDYAEDELSVTDINAPSATDVQHTGEGSLPTSREINSSTPSSTASPVSATPSWINAGSYEAAAKQDPNISRGQYAYELGKYRREQGQPDLSYTEWANIIKGQDPYETAAEKEKREKNMRIAKNINAIGSFINALVNYNRVKGGHVSYRPDNGTEGYNRLERIRTGQQALAQSRAKDYLGMMTQDRAERARTEAAAAAAAKAQRDYDFRVSELEWKKENAKTEAERKAAADALAKEKFEESKRHNKAMETVAYKRAGSGSGSGTKKYLELHTANGTKRFTPDENGSNWIHQAYQEMLKQPDGKSYEVKKFGSIYGGSSAPSEQEMYEAITKYNDAQWKNQYRSNRYGGGSKKEEIPPLE